MSQEASKDYALRATDPPHIPLFVSELAALSRNDKSLQEWDGKSVRIVGRVREFHPTCSIAVVESLQQLEDEIVRVEVDFSIIDSLTFSNNEVINVLGELALKNEKEIKIVAKVVNDFSTINLQEYAEGISYIRETFPNLMRW